MISGFFRVLAAIVSSFAVLWLGVIAGLWWDRRPHGEPTFDYHVFGISVLKLSAPDSLKVTAYAQGRADQLAADRAVAAAKVTAQAESSARIAAQDRAAQVRIRTVTRTLVKEVSSYVTPEADRAARIPMGFVWLHDRAALMPAAGQGAGQPDGGPPGPPTAAEADADSGLTLSTVGTTVTENYGTCHLIRQQLLDLQRWEQERESIASR